MRRVVERFVFRMFVRTSLLMGAITAALVGAVEMQDDTLEAKEWERAYSFERKLRERYETALTAILNHDCGCDPKAPWCECAAELRNAARDALNGRPITLGIVSSEVSFSEVSK